MKTETLVTEVPIRPDILADILAGEAEAIIGRWRGFTIIGRVPDGFQVSIHYKGRLSKVDVEGILVVRRGKGYVSYIFTGENSKLIIDMRIRRGRWNTILFMEAVYEGRGERAAGKMIKEILREISRYVLEKVSSIKEELVEKNVEKPPQLAGAEEKPAGEKAKAILREALQEKTVPIEEKTTPLPPAPGKPEAPPAPVEKPREAEKPVEKPSPPGKPGPDRVERELKELPIDHNRLPDRSLALSDPVRLANILLRSSLVHRFEEHGEVSLKRILGRIAGRRELAGYTALYVSVKTRGGEGRIILEDGKITGAYASIAGKEHLGVDALRNILGMSGDIDVRIWGIKGEL